MFRKLCTSSRIVSDKYLPTSKSSSADAEHTTPAHTRIYNYRFASSWADSIRLQMLAAWICLPTKPNRVSVERGRIRSESKGKYLYLHGPLNSMYQYKLLSIWKAARICTPISCNQHLWVWRAPRSARRRRCTITIRLRRVVYHPEKSMADFVDTRQGCARRSRHKRTRADNSVSVQHAANLRRTTTCIIHTAKRQQNKIK